MCIGQSHFHINSLHPEGKSSSSSWIKGLLYCIELPVSHFNHCGLFFSLNLEQENSGNPELNFCEERRFSGGGCGGCVADDL